MPYRFLSEVSRMHAMLLGSILILTVVVNAGAQTLRVGGTSSALGTVRMQPDATTKRTETEVPQEVPGATIVFAPQVRSMLDGGALVVDTRVGNEFAESHIKGAVNIPYKERSDKSKYFDAAKDKFDLSKLPSDKDKSIVFYCNAGECWKSYKASTVALRTGYRHVYWFRGGYPEWVKLGLPVD